MSKCKTYWALLHIPSGKLVELIAFGRAFSIFRNKTEIRWVLCDSIVDYNTFISLKPEYYRNSIKEAFGDSVSIWDFMVVRIQLHTIHDQTDFFTGVQEGLKHYSEDYTVAFIGFHDDPL